VPVTAEDRQLIRDCVSEAQRLDSQIAALRRQRSQLTTRALAEKMGYCHKTVANIARGVRK